jgi:hypothetical protein
MYNTILPKIKSSPTSVTAGLKELFLLVLLQNSGYNNTWIILSRGKLGIFLFK